jgi:hypothetical protein
LVLDDPPVNVPPDSVNAPAVATVVDDPLTVAVPPEITIELTLTLALIVTVPVLIVTSSDAPGMPFGLQFPARFQLPEVTFQDLGVARALPWPARTMAANAAAAPTREQRVAFLAKSRRIIPIALTALQAV